MSEKNAETVAARQVELAVSRLDSLSTLPCVGARFLSELFQGQPSSSPVLADIVEADAALAAKVLSLAYQQALTVSGKDFSIKQLLDRLPAHAIRDACLSVNIFKTGGSEQDNEEVLPKKAFVLHQLAVACCAKNIAETITGQIDSQSAYLAGLLHDMGKLALAEVMPKSFTRIVEEARSQQVGICTIERKHLGLDHTTLGRRLAQKWHLPKEIELAIWLHHSDTVAICQDMSEARIAQVVQLADLTARQCGIGQSGSYDSADSTDAIARSLSISAEQLGQISGKLPEQVEQISKLIGLDLPRPEVTYYGAVHDAAGQLAREHTKLSLENRRLQTTSSHFNFVRDFLLTTDSTDSAVEVAENFAACWQRFYQTGPVCLYLTVPACAETLDAVIVEGPSKTESVALNAPVDSPAIPQAIASSFVILDAKDHADWLFEQLETDFALDKTKLMPLLSNGKAIGAIVFEFRHPAESEQIQEEFKTATSIGAAVLDMALTCGSHQRFAEHFAQLLGKPRARQLPQAVQKEQMVEQKREPTAPLVSLAEMAAGAAHELNNPLSVIAGRAQLLAQSENDLERKQILEQISENAGEISQIVDDLMSFAQPLPPRPAQMDIKQIIEEAIQLTSQKTKIEHINVQVEAAEGLKTVFVDSGQVVSAIASILSNSLESYTDQLGPIKITAKTDGAAEAVKLQISDLGCGMDAETLQKATHPFFSAKPAGRKRGMGLAHAQRIIELNKGSLRIDSQPGGGTTVTILLPGKA